MVGTRSIAVIGAGVLGSACAAALAARGAEATLFDASEGRPNASRAAAGMIAPAFEAVLENASEERASLYRAAAALWPGFAAAVGVRLVHDGAEWLGQTDGLAERFRRLGFDFELTRRGLVTGADFRLDPADALARLTAGAAHGGRVEAVSVWPGGVRLTTDGEERLFDAAVLATGWSGEGLRLRGSNTDAVIRQLDMISPIRGQIVTVSGVQLARPTRAPGVYVVPRDESVLVGATMEPGRSDLTPDPDSTRRLLEAATTIFPWLAEVPQDRVSAAVGVRGASPDGAPMAGGTAAPGLFAALAPRRNGWLFAPLVAEVVARAVFGEAPGPLDHLLKIDRFD